TFDFYLSLLGNRTLLAEYKDDIDVFDVGRLPDGVEMVCWGLKKINDELKGKVVEIGIDATYNTNSRHLELYSMVFEYDNAGFPGTYCFLTTASAVEPGKRTKSIALWANAVKEHYGVNPCYVHLDKDMAEIGAAKLYLRRAVRERLKSSKVRTTPYHPDLGHAEFDFIDPNFVPINTKDKTDYEGGDPALFLPLNSQIVKNSILLTQPSSSVPKLTVRIPPPTQPSSCPPPSVDAAGIPKIRIPPKSYFEADSEIEDPWESGADESSSGEESMNPNLRTFCPSAHREHIIDVMERHYCAHPLIPGYAYPSAEGIRKWAVRQMYTFCFQNNLAALWAYLWENWYRPTRWELWARSVSDTVPILKTTMMVEAHWRRIKHDFLHHFHSPRVDLLAWILITKLVPLYLHRLKEMMVETGRFRNLASWRKGFKSEWKRLETRPIAQPVSDAYRPDPLRWVRRSRSTPFWSHKAFYSGDILTANDYTEESEIIDAEEEAQGQKTFDESISEHITLLREFAD
ncbi:hypothetical protein GGU10DRAFT_337877, partial [Lentinula aff. detonsa]